MKKPIIFSICLVGFVAMASQIVLVRELLIVFCGNELSLAFILASWLVGGAIGSALLGAFSDKLRRRVSVFGACQTVLAILLPLAVIAVRSIRPVLGINPGEIVPIFPVASASLIILLPICMILGFSFALASRIHKPELKSGASRIGEVYILEALGAMGGGIIASFILVRYLSSTQIMGALGLLMVLAAIMLLKSSGEEKSRRWVSFFAGLVFSLYIVLWIFGGWKVIDKHLLKMEWRGSELLASRNSIYSNIAVTRRGGDQFSFFDNGLHLYTVPDKPTAEEAVNFGLLEHPHPKRVLLIGGGAGGLLGEIARHPAEKIDYVELDPLIIKMAQEYLPPKYRAWFSDPKVSIIFEDGRRYVKRTAEKYDCIIINIGDPYTAQLNRFYTLEFYNEAANIMNDGGVLSFGLGASESYIGRELADFLSSIYATLGKAFPEVKVIPGETAYFLASTKKGVLTYDYKLLMARAKERGLELKYLRDYYLFSRMSPELISYTENAIKGSRKIMINRDFRPASYYYGITAWAARFKDSSLVKALKSVNEKLVWSAVICVLIAILAVGLLSITKIKIFKGAAMLSVLVNGFSQMAFQIIILLAFQMIYGCMFYKLGIILTAFMAGIALGGRFGLRILSHLDLNKNKYALIILQGGLCLYPFLLSAVLELLSGQRGEIINWLGSNIIFLALPVFSGFLGGFIFPIASALCLNKEEERGATAGINYGSDLFGSCVGALLAGIFLIPILGIPKTCLVIAALNFKVLLVLIAGVVFL